jgi:hypothetical protein
MKRRLQRVRAATSRPVLAKELVVVVLGDDTVKHAVALDELLRRQSPLALVRAVELAELVLDASTGSKRAGHAANA